MLIIHRGDQFVIPSTIKLNGITAVTPSNCAGVKMKIASIEKYYPDGGLTFNSTSNKWEFPITQEETLAIKGGFQAQVQVKFAGTPPVIIGTDISRERMENSIITEEWDNE